MGTHTSIPQKNRVKHRFITEMEEREVSVRHGKKSPLFSRLFYKPEIVEPIFSAQTSTYKTQDYHKSASRSHDSLPDKQ